MGQHGGSIPPAPLPKWEDTLSDPSQVITQKAFSRLPTAKFNWYLNQANFWFSRMTAYQAQLDALLVSPVESYTFSGGEGQQSAKRRDLEQIQRGLEHAESRYLFYWSKCYGTGNPNMVLRRR